MPESPADTIRRAASEIADDAPLATRGVRPFLLAVSGWLDSQAEELAAADGAVERCDEPGSVRSALAIARAYIGED